MKLKPHLLITSIALLTSAALAAEPAPKTAPNAVWSNSGKATITIEVNGHKETREIDLQSFGETKLDAGAGGSGPGAATFGGGALPAGARPGAGQPAALPPPPKTVTWLGVAQEEIPEEIRAQLPLEPGTGLLLRSVLPDSPAAQAGLQKNDVLLKIDDQLLTQPSQLRTLITAKKEGDTVKLTYLRRGQQATLDAKLATHEESAAPSLTDTLDVDYRKTRLDLAALPKATWFYSYPQTNALILDNTGQVIGHERQEFEATVGKLTKTLREVGVDEKSILEATRALTEMTQAIRDAVSDAGVAKNEVQKGSGEIAKALAQVRDAIEKVRQQTEEAVRQERENRRTEKP